MKVLYKGAEAIISEKKQTDASGVYSIAVIKERIKKSYRLPEIDEKLRKQRTKSEASLLREAARAGVNVPRILEENDFTLTLEKINGNMVKDMLNEKNMPEICKKIGQSVANLHSFDIIHGDLTTSNMILSSSDIYLLDFGLGFRSGKAEDKATDLHVLREALESTHFEWTDASGVKTNLAEKAWKIILKAYKESYKSEKVIGSLKNLEKRGRYRDRSG